MLLRHPATLLAVFGATAILGVVAAGQSLYVSSSQAGAFAAQMAQRCPGEMGAWVMAGITPRAAGAQSASLERRVASDLARAGAAPDVLGAPVTTLVAGGLSVSGTGGRTSFTTLYDRDGATANVRVLERVPGEGVWITDSTATELGVRAGGSLELGGRVPVRVAAVYANLQDAPRPLPTFWCSQEMGPAGFIGPPDANFPPPPLTLADRREFDALSSDLHLGEVTYEWQRALPQRAVTADQGHAVVRALSSLLAQLPPTRSPRGFGPPLTLGTDASFVVARAGAIGQAVANSVEPVSLAGVIVALLLVAAAGSYWVDRRRLEVALLRSRGISGAMIGLKALLEMAPWAVLGATAGVGVARLVVWWLGPSSLVATSSVWAGVGDAAWACGGGLVVLGLVAAVRASVRPRPVARLRRWLALIPVELFVLALAGVAWWRLTGSNLDLAPAGASVASVGPLYLAFPVLFVVGAAVLLARGAAASVPALRRWAAPRRLGLFLGVARLAAAPRLAASLFAAAAAAVGMLVFASALEVTQQHAVDAKAQTVVGSATAVYLERPVRVPASLRATTTEVERLANADVGTEYVDVVGIDPTTFGRAAFWSPAYGAGSPAGAAALLAAAHVSAGTLPAIVANGSLGAHPTLSVSSDTGPITLRLRVLEVVPGFTLTNASNVLVVTTVQALRGLPIQAELLSRSDANTVLSALAPSGVSVTAVVRAGDALDETEFLSVTWSFAYLQALGVLVGLVVVAGMLLYIETRQRSRATAYAMAHRMGLSRGSHLGAVALELGAPMVVGAGVGIGLGLGAAALVYGSLNPLPDFPPGPLLATPVLVLAGAMVATLVTWGAGVAWSQRGAERISPGVLLRGEQ